MWLGSEIKRTKGLTPRPILIVEDDDETRILLRFALSEWGYRVVCAGDGGEAIAIARDLIPAAIILDLWLPKVSGFTFRAWQLEQPHLVNVPVIVLTAAGPGAADPLHDVAALYKPVDVDLLKALLEVQLATQPIPANARIPASGTTGNGRVSDRLANGEVGETETRNQATRLARRR